MEPDADPLPILLSQVIDASFLVGCGVVLFMLVLSALVSGSEVAFFSLSPSDLEQMEQDKSKRSDRAMRLLDKPNKLLATILIANNFINVGIVILSTFLVDRIFATTALTATAQFIIQVVVVTFVILLLGEVLPKVYATKNSRSFAKFMSTPLTFAKHIFNPLSSLLVRSTSFIDKRVKVRASNISVDHLEQALELTDDGDLDDKESEILKGIVKFGNTDVKQIMTPRMDMTGLEKDMPYLEVLSIVINSGFSRIPVYEESADKVVGVLYIKDLLPHRDENSEFDWAALMRKPFFVPENKKIDDLLREFQDSKVHVAIVVDEYGGTSGLVTFEDIIEEIVGEISDEFDDDDIVYSKLDDHNYVFEGKTPLIDLYRILDIDGESFEGAKGESDTIAGFLIEVSGKILKKHERVSFENYDFTVEAADKRRVKQVKITITDVEDA